ncbi:peptidylprolyl isomerase [Hyphomonas sp. WL0036]|uniref:peptidylprolyl isomerase n=1 Tax=Hyphomonas sediminis TaxID=2866160 RepID=UPI001C7F3F24|nr:peptidylprolyl isomerase [Hyphomonas sediminis]MBY9065647.1 peptidylprolyl isomerase [Hyphomonas sediminis]
MKRLIALSAALMGAACVSAPAALTEPAPEAAPTAAAQTDPDWRAVEPENLVLITLETGMVAIELFPEAAPAHAAQIREAVREGFYDDEFFYRVVEGHVAQAGREFSMAIAAWPTLPFEAEREVPADGFDPQGNADLFAAEAGHREGFAVGRENGKEWLLNCPGSLGMARDANPSSGSTEIYIPLQPRRYLDRNYTLFGRVIDGMEYIHRLPRVDPSTEEEEGALFGEDEELAYQIRQYRRSKLAGNQILSARMAADLPAEDRPSYEVMRTPSPAWEALKESKRDYSAVDAFAYTPPKVLDVCALPVPARRVGE